VKRETDTLDGSPLDVDSIAYGWVGNDGTLDGITSVMSHEVVEAASDPYGDGIRVDPGAAWQWGGDHELCARSEHYKKNDSPF
jgi:hypothetical protein